jgi:ACDE family multidrug resistance protein
MFDRFALAGLRRAPAPGVRSFALLSGLDAAVRGILISVLPLELYAAYGDAAVVSGIYFAVGCLSLVAGLLVPRVAAAIGRRWAYSVGGCLFVVGHLCGIAGGSLMAAAVLCISVGTVMVFVCLNAYVLDYIARSDLGRTESTRMLYAALPWTAGPLLGVELLEAWRPLPFLVAGFLALMLLGTFWALRLGNGRAISRARGPSPNPLAYLGRFAQQPRLVAGWVFAVIRSSGWWVFAVYLPIFAVEAGLGKKIGGATLSIASALMFLTPVMLRWMQARSVRAAVRAGFIGAGACLGLAAAMSGWPWAAVAAMMGAAFFLVLLDAVGGLPFLLAVKPSERAEMAGIYSSFRDVSGIVTPGVAWLVLTVAPIPGIFAAMGVLFGGVWMLAGRLHPKLGVPLARRHPRAAAGRDVAA